jgi:LmbE family N-acetylglucosaminyl deacetylase
MKVLVVCAHADDEVLGAGATLAKHAENGDDIRIIYMTGKITSRDSSEKWLGQERIHVSKYLGASFIVEDFPDQLLDTIPHLTINKVVEREIATFKPGLIYTHSMADANKDHRMVSSSVKVAAWNVRTRMFEVPNRRRPPNQFNPNYYEDIEGFMDDKIQLLSFYRSELRKYPDPRSIGGVMILARYRGLQRMMKFAEAFEEVL